MVSLNQISLAYPGKTLLHEVSFMIKPGDRIGLIGRNGAGKSTLLKVLAGQTTPDGGSVAVPREFTIGFLTQVIDLDEHNSVRNIASEGQAVLEKIKNDLQAAEVEMTTRTDYESDSYLDLIAHFSHLSERFHLLGGAEAEGNTEKILLGLGFQSHELDRALSTFSGGWKMRVALARLLLSQPDLLLLDEPTNHLDIDSIMWLEEYLQTYPGAVVVISHDQAFLDRVTNRTIEIVKGRIYDIPAPYTRFMELRAEQREIQARSARNQEKEIKETQELIDRFKAKASKASFAQSLMKKLDRMETIEVDETDSSAMRFRFPPAPRSGKVVIHAEKVTKNYGDKPVLKGVDLEIEKGERVAFVGQNGQGKSTLVKIISERLPHGGTIQLGHQVFPGYYAQEQTEVLRGDITVLKTLEDEAPDEVRPQVRSLLGAFLFSGEDVTKKVKVLSGGERGRLALARLLLKPVNLLILDEPTNHLDIASKNMLKQALIQFDGTLVVVSHDREFLRDLVNKTYEFKDGKVITHLGGIDYFLEQKKMENMRAFEAQKQQRVKEKAKRADADKEVLSKEWDKEIKKAEKRLAELEETIAQLEANLAQWDAELEVPEKVAQLSEQAGFFEEYDRTKAELNNWMAQWDDASATLLQLESAKAAEWHGQQS
jgi:ATP-binding cassette subfamily F protein 3